MVLMALRGLLGIEGLAALVLGALPIDPANHHLAVDDILSIEVEADLNNDLTVIDGGLVANRIG